jgi:hypothetical protein
LRPRAAAGRPGEVRSERMARSGHARGSFGLAGSRRAPPAPRSPRVRAPLHCTLHEPTARRALKYLPFIPVSSLASKPLQFLSLRLVTDQKNYVNLPIRVYIYHNTTIASAHICGLPLCRSIIYRDFIHVLPSFISNFRRLYSLSSP